MLPELHAHPEGGYVDEDEVGELRVLGASPPRRRPPRCAGPASYSRRCPASGIWMCWIPLNLSPDQMWSELVPKWSGNGPEPFRTVSGLFRDQFGPFRDRFGPIGTDSDRFRTNSDRFQPSFWFRGDPGQPCLGRPDLAVGPWGVSFWTAATDLDENMCFQFWVRVLHGVVYRIRQKWSRFTKIVFKDWFVIICVELNVYNIILRKQLYTFISFTIY